MSYSNNNFVFSTVDIVEEPEKDVLNSAVLGATLYAADEAGSLIRDSENLTVIITFRHLLTGDKYNLTGNN